MSSMHVVSGSKSVRPLSSLCEGTHGRIVEVRSENSGRADRLLALGVTPGALVTVMQTFPGVVFLCDQTELAVERDVAAAILIRPLEIEP
jgi:DtxR family Mn-dependent transcriptional regulator